MQDILLTTNVTRSEELPDIPGRPKDLIDQIKAHLAAELEAGGTLYGTRSDGCYIARTKDGDRVLRRPGRKSD